MIDLETLPRSVRAVLDDPSLADLRRQVAAVDLPAGEVVFREGDECRNYLLVIDGRVRVQKVTAGGREIVLYRIAPGQGCVLTTSCLFSGDPYPAEGVTETPSTALAIPMPSFQAGLAASASFRRFVFASYAERLADLIALVQEVAFGRTDVRLARRLLAQATPAGTVRTTHQALAVDLGTAREVISRHLKALERMGWVRLHRGTIDIVEPAALARLVDADTV